MKLRKLFALLMAAVMLLGMMPAAHAEQTNCNHDWDDGQWLNGEPVDCNDWKTKTYTCTICGAINEWREVGHCEPGDKTWIRPQGSNCQEFGVWEICCKHCGEWLEGGEEPGPHQWDHIVRTDPTCVEPGWEETFCSVCGDEKGDGHEIPVIDHSWVTRTLEEPSCEYPGLKETVCSACGSEQNGPEEIPALGHDWSDWVWDYEPTCTQSGWKHRSCNRCRHREEEEVRPIDHQWVTQTILQPGCDSLGYKDGVCSACGAKQGNREDIPALGHDWGSWYWVNEQPSCNQGAWQNRTCNRCG